MWSLSKIWEKVCKVAEGGSHYCSKKSDDNCGGASDEVKSLFLFYFFYNFFLLTLFVLWTD